jgi:hypothetical protein
MQNVSDRNVPRRGVLWFAVIALGLCTGFMALFFAQRGWHAADVGFVAVCSIVTLALLATLMNAARYWWAMRVVTFIIFSLSFWYLIDEAFINRHPEQIGNPGEVSTFNAIRGFLFFGLPSLLYTLWGSTWGKLGTPKPTAVTNADILILRLAIYGRWLFLALTVLTLAVALLKS